jgi:formate dehydrogenase iron-sulfur subunit
MTASSEALQLRAPAAAARSERPKSPLLPVAALLRKQHVLTAVERFSQKHDEGSLPAQAKYYQHLIEPTQPGPGEQYAFEVDLDACTGCKACVVACHSLNGLDEDEAWRGVGLLHGGTPAAPALQTVTSSCHHCLDPACMKGCPVGAYEKDPITGIVRHLDDQCFGCQYCTLMCPYDAPKFNKARGIVRKCDMCSERLAHGEAPACVQGCPNEAIAIRIVDQATVVQVSEAQNFLPGAPAPDHTLPTTVYKTKKATAKNLLPADFYTTRPEHSHPPLVVMLTLTQLSAGAFAMELLSERLSGRALGSPLAHTVFACALALIALGASVFHLGRPWLAWRAFIGLRTSWLSREAVVFGVFAKLALMYGLLSAAPFAAPFAAPLQIAAALAGVVGVFCSVMVYVATRREQWAGSETGVRFFGTTLALGAASVLCVGTLTAGSVRPDAMLRPLLFVVMVAMGIKLVFEARLLLYARSKQQTVRKRMALLMLGDLSVATRLRFALGVLGGLVLPLACFRGWLANEYLPAAVTGMLLVITGAELAERYLFFRAAPGSRMPGGVH